MTTLPLDKKATGATNWLEQAVLVINGREYKDWTSITVCARYTEYNATFSFECTEFTPSGKLLGRDFTNMQIKPGDKVMVFLSGEQVLTGYVTERQAGYSARMHGVRIAGISKTWDLTTTSVSLEQSGNYDNKNWAQLAQALIGSSGIGLKMIGEVDLTPFKNIQVSPGEMRSEVLERYARARCIIIGSNPFGDLLAIGKHNAFAQDALIEGENILAANCVIRDDKVYKRIYATGQRHGDDQSNGDETNKIIAQVTGSSTRDRVLVVPMDIGDDEHGVKQRANIELNFTEGATIEAHITVQGWRRRSGSLWQAGDYYYVRSPMLMLDHLLGCREVEYHQSERSGTITTLKMVDPFHMNGKPDFSGKPPS